MTSNQFLCNTTKRFCNSLYLFHFHILFSVCRRCRRRRRCRFRRLLLCVVYTVLTVSLSQSQYDKRLSFIECNWIIKPSVVTENTTATYASTLPTNIYYKCALRLQCDIITRFIGTPKSVETTKNKTQTKPKLMCSNFVRINSNCARFIKTYIAVTIYWTFQMMRNHFHFKTEQKQQIQMIVVHSG